MIKIHDMFISIKSGSPEIADLISTFFEEIVEDTTNEQLENESTT